MQNVLKWSQGSVDFSYQLAFDSANPEWIRNRFSGWKNFDERSVAKIEGGLGRHGPALSGMARS